jgi:hypothetical protein
LDAVAVLHGFKNLGEFERAKRDNDEKETQDKAQVADAVDDEGLFPGDRVANVLEPKANQQVGTEPNQFPAHKHHQIVIGHHQDQHRGQKQVKVDKEALETWIAVHIAYSVDVNQRTNAADD